MPTSRPGRPPLGATALSSTERSRRLRAQVADLLSAALEPTEASDSVLLMGFEKAYRTHDRAQIGRLTRELLRRRSLTATKPETPEHQRQAASRSSTPSLHQTLFAIPTAPPSDSTALVAPQLPEQTRITGDLEVDAVLWLGKVCKMTTDLAVLDKALDAAAKIQTPAEELERRYSDWIMRQPGAHPMQAAFGSFGMADIQGKVERARTRIRTHAEALAIFGTLDAALADTPAEAMLDETVGELPTGDYWRWSTEQLADLFARSVNPASLTECVAELRYWHWLYDTRRHMYTTTYPDEYAPDPSELVSAREYYVKGLLTVLPPVDRAEAIHIADALKDGLIDIGSVDDGKEQARVLDHLLRA